MITTALPIETPEGISFSYEPASLSDRGFAYLIDLLIRISVVLALGILVAYALGPAQLAGMGVWLFLAFVVEWGYYVLFESLWDGQSPGKRVFNLRVVKSDGHPIGFYDCALRNLLRAADLLPATYAVGILSVLATRRLQRLGDLAAGTIVVVERRAWFSARRHARSSTTPGPPAPETEATLRALALSNRERRLLESFTSRMHLLPPARREQIASILAAPYRRRLSLPRGLEGLRASDLLVELHRTQASSRAPREHRP